MTLLGITVIAFTAGTVEYLIYKSSPDDKKKEEEDKE